MQRQPAHTIAFYPSANKPFAVAARYKGIVVHAMMKMARYATRTNAVVCRPRLM